MRSSRVFLVFSVKKYSLGAYFGLDPWTFCCAPFGRHVGHLAKMTNHRPKVWSGVTCCYRSRGEMLLMLGSTEGTRGKALIDTDEIRMVVGY